MLVCLFEGFCSLKIEHRDRHVHARHNHVCGAPLGASTLVHACPVVALATCYKFNKLHVPSLIMFVVEFQESLQVMKTQ